MLTHKENSLSHISDRITERFTNEDFTVKSKIHGVTNFAPEVINSIVNAVKVGKEVKGAYGYRKIYRVQCVPGIRPVYVVWDMQMNFPVTVLTEEMIN
jgi:hypothetical protein|tara:strand:- start:400 stop:693 length:294 start_codon:yes stop_codon:yes gene_type:complete